MADIIEVENFGREKTRQEVDFVTANVYRKIIQSGAELIRFSAIYQGNVILELDAAKTYLTFLAKNGTTSETEYRSARVTFRNSDSEVESIEFPLRSYVPGASLRSNYISFLIGLSRNLKDYIPVDGHGNPLVIQSIELN